MHKQMKAKNGPISYRDVGAGLPVVLLHGFGEDSEIWNEQLPGLLPFCRLIIPDLPGSGRSPRWMESKVAMEAFADCIDEILSRENIGECIMLGHSMGGYITLAFAEKFPHKLSAWGLIHSSAYADTDEKIMTRKKGIQHIEAYGPQSFLKTSIPTLFSKRTQLENASIISALIEKGSTFSKEALIQYYQAMITRPDRRHVLKSSEIPVLFILGTEDVAAPMKDILDQVQLPNQSFVFIIEETGHMSMIEKPLEVTHHLTGFLKSFIAA